ncbi:TetR/AcrR family transcriptional regulator [Macrococcus hajekii]|uniref:TetR/AcrR family transcriptional regulator n=1 Tax=Macrococcus hajekii TaxID=198482 RepID=A0A4V3BDX9_9STAP|nr:TetR/AcrR family transcriptional regulator [Macrococcus hajekii]TDM01974.1 TetR/AcrR family transcriptional regulator [Macrococcus hajekii]GGB08971.1 TetR family transcriptional regulator [Macrococcus hajekii]
MNNYHYMNIKTQQNIQGSFIDLLSEKDFSKISIQNIADKADINRGTFYLHYLDKYDLLEQIITQLLHSLEHYINNIQQQEVLKSVHQGDLISHSTPIFQYIKNNQKLFTTLMTSTYPFNFQQQFKQLLITQFTEKTEEPADDQTYQAYITNFTSSAYLGVIEEWINRDMKETPEELSALYMKIILKIREM